MMWLFRKRQKPAKFIPYEYVDCPYCGHTEETGRLCGVLNKHGHSMQCNRCMRSFFYEYPKLHDGWRV